MLGLIIRPMMEALDDVMTFYQFLFPLCASASARPEIWYRFLGCSVLFISVFLVRLYVCLFL
ncbi:hypothetical protein BDV32DRAFT_57989 [Aspergillus pseudonomiae]|nr:hypothetical protein BDV32DRAFT_57989 [Aspergillus pseudonomiae]